MSESDAEVKDESKSNMADNAWELALSSMQQIDTTKEDEVLAGNVMMRHMLVGLLGADTGSMKDPKYAKVLLSAMADNDKSILAQKRINIDEADADKAELFRREFLHIMESRDPNAISAGFAGQPTSNAELELAESLDNFEFVEGETHVGNDIYKEGEEPEIKRKETTE